MKKQAGWVAGPENRVASGHGCPHPAWLLAALFPQPAGGSAAVPRGVNYIQHCSCPQWQPPLVRGVILRGFRRDGVGRGESLESTWGAGP